MFPGHISHMEKMHRKLRTHEIIQQFKRKSLRDLVFFFYSMKKSKILRNTLSQEGKRQYSEKHCFVDNHIS